MALAVVVICVVMVLPLFAKPGLVADLNNGDWRQLYFHHKAARDAVLDGGTPCFWNPHVNGGFPLASHPHDPSFSPLFPIILIAGEVLGFRINVLLVFLAGVAGMALLTRFCLGYGRWGVFFSCLIYTTAGWFPARLYGGNYWEVFYYLFPLIAFCVASANKDRRYLLAGTLLIYLLLAEANFVLPVSLLFLGLLWILGKLIFGGPGADPDRVITAKNLLLCTVFSVLVGAVKFYLLSGLLAMNPREVEYALFKMGSDAKMHRNPYEGLIGFWYGYIKVRPFAQTAMGADGPARLWLGPGYIGCGAVALLSACASVLFNWRRFGPIVLLLGASIALTFSLYLSMDIFMLLSKLPIFGSMVNTVKYFNYFIFFFICIGAGGCGQFILSRSKIPVVKSLLTLLFTAAFLSPMISNGIIIPKTFIDKAPEPGPGAGFSQVDYYPLYMNLMHNTGVTIWNSSIRLPTQVIPQKILDPANKRWVPNKGYLGEAWFAKGRGEAQLKAISANRIDVAARTSQPGVLVINQNYDPGWSSPDGEILDYGGLLAVSLSKMGDHAIQLTYRPKGVGWAVLVSLLSTIFLLWFCFKGAWRTPAPKNHLDTFEESL